MTKSQFLIAGLCALGLAAPLASHADDMSKYVINNPRVEAWVIYGPQTNKKIKDPNVQWGDAVEVKMATASANEWDAAAQTDITGPMKKGDHIQCVVQLKGVAADGTSPVKLHMRVQLNAAPYPAFADQDITLTNDWQYYQLDATADKDYAKSTNVLVIHLSTGAQTVDLGPAFILDNPPAAQ